MQALFLLTHAPQLSLRPILFDILQLRVGGRSFQHPVTGEQIPLKRGFTIFSTANLRSERYRTAGDLTAEELRRLVSGAGVREIHYLDYGKKRGENELIAPETLKILSAVIADRRGFIAWSEMEAPQKIDELKRFAAACRKIQEEFTETVLRGAESGSLARSGRLPIKELVITLENQINIMRAWKEDDFQKPLEDYILKEFFRKAEISGKAAEDRATMVRIFMAQRFFADAEPKDFRVPALTESQVKAWQGKS